MGVDRKSDIATARLAIQVVSSQESHACQIGVDSYPRHCQVHRVHSTGGAYFALIASLRNDVQSVYKTGKYLVPTRKSS